MHDRRHNSFGTWWNNSSFGESLRRKRLYKRSFIESRVSKGRRGLHTITSYSVQHAKCKMLFLHYIWLHIQSVSTLLGIYWRLYFFFFFSSPSAAVACPHRGLMCFVFRDALLHTTVVMHGYLRYWSFFSDLSHSTHFCPQNCCSNWMFFFPAPFSANSRDCCVWKSQEISSFWDTQTTLSGTNNHSTVKVT